MRVDTEETNYKDVEINISGGGSGAEERVNQGIDEIAAGLREKVAMSVTNLNDLTTDAAHDDDHFIETACVDVGNPDNDVGETPYRSNDLINYTIEGRSRRAEKSRKVLMMKIEAA